MLEEGEAYTTNVLAVDEIYLCVVGAETRINKHV